MLKPLLLRYFRYDVLSEAMKSGQRKDVNEKFVRLFRQLKNTTLGRYSLYIKRNSLYLYISQLIKIFHLVVACLNFLSQFLFNLISFLTSSPQSPWCRLQLPELSFLIWSQQVKRGRLGLSLVSLPTVSFRCRPEVLDECYYVIQYGQHQIEVLS